MIILNLYIIAHLKKTEFLLQLQENQKGHGSMTHDGTQAASKRHPFFHYKKHSACEYRYQNRGGGGLMLHMYSKVSFKRTGENQSMTS